MRLLYVEDQVESAAIVKEELSEFGFAVDHATTIEDADYIEGLAEYDAVILDRHLPDGDGLQWLQAIRKRGCDTPAIILTAFCSGPVDIASALNYGADDFLCKPFMMEELSARLRAILRRRSDIKPDILTCGDISVNTLERSAQVNGQMILLSRRELTLLECLLERHGRVVTKDFLTNALYSFDDEASENAIEVAVHRLRKSLQNAGSACKVITRRGLGYVLISDVERAA